MALLGEVVEGVMWGFGRSEVKSGDEKGRNECGWCGTEIIRGGRYLTK